MKKIAIMGAGGFGSALAFVLSRNKHQVTLWDRDKDRVAHWQKLKYSDRYPYLIKHRFPSNLQLTSEKISAAAFDFIIISSSLAGLESTLQNIDFNSQTPLVLIQKGMLEGLTTPIDIAKKICPKTTVIQFTGAGFAKDLVSGAPAGMIVLHRPRDRQLAGSFSQLFHGSSIWPTCCTDILGINIHNTLRTIASFEQGLIYGFFENKFANEPPVSTIAITFSAISQEAKRIARLLGASQEIHQIDSKIYRIIEADLMLCQNDSSRNFALGHLVGQGLSLGKAKRQITDGVAECLPNILTIHQELQSKIGRQKIKLAYPYLKAAKAMIDDGNIKAEIAAILAHHESYLA